MSNDSTEPISREGMLRMTTDVVSAYVGNNATATNQIPDLIKTVHNSLNALGEAQAARAGAANAGRCPPVADAGISWVPEDWQAEND